MKVVAIGRTIKAPEVFKFPRCPDNPLWFGYIEYKTYLEYQNTMYKHTDDNKDKIYKHIISRIKEKAGKYVDSVEIDKYVDTEGNVMYTFSMYDINKNPIRANISHTGLELQSGNRWIPLNHLIDSDGVSESPGGNYENRYRWKRVSTKIGKEKLLERISDWLDDDKIQDLKIHYSGDGIYAVHKSTHE